MIRAPLGKEPKNSHDSGSNEYIIHSIQANSMTNVSSLSSVGSNITNAASNATNTTSQTKKLVKSISSSHSRKKPRYRPNQAKKKNKRFVENYG